MGDGRRKYEKEGANKRTTPKNANNTKNNNKEKD
jgi:hypothetical protein